VVRVLVKKVLYRAKPSKECDVSSKDPDTEQSGGGEPPPLTFGFTSVREIDITNE
jgi:hypothetical protein